MTTNFLYEVKDLVNDNLFRKTVIFSTNGDRQELILLFKRIRLRISSTSSCLKSKVRFYTLKMKTDIYIHIPIPQTWMYTFGIKLY